MRDNAMGDAGTKRIAEAVAVHPALLLLDVGYNRISPKVRKGRGNANERC